MDDQDNEGLEAARDAMSRQIEVDAGQIQSVAASFGDGGNAPPPDDPGDPGPMPDDPGRGHPAPPENSNPIETCATFPLNDYGNGCRFVEHFGTELLFVSRVGWHVWDGMRWSPDEEISKDLAPRVRRMAHRLGALIEQEVDFLRPTSREASLLDEERELMRRAVELEGLDRDLDDQEKAELSGVMARLKALESILKSHKSRVGRHINHAKNAGNNGPLNHMINEARTMLTVDPAEMDAAPLEINCLSGVLRFGKTTDGYASVDLVPHNRSQRHSKIMPVEYDPDARADVFEQFLFRIQPNADMRGFLARWMGLGMTGLTGEQKLAYFHGGGGNGKSVLVDLIAKILGDYSSTAKIESLTGNTRRGGADATPDMMPLVGARMVRASEPDQGTQLQEGLIKELTGGEPMKVRALHSDFIDFLPIFKLTISGNHRPEIRGDDDGIWRRVMLVPFDVQIPKAERDRDLPAKLWAERSGILNWLIAGLCDYLENGLAEPELVLNATSEYREDSDPLGQFLTNCCVVTGLPEHSIRATDLRDAFQFWQMQNGGHVWTDGTVARRLGDKQGKWRSSDGKMYARRISVGVKFYDGIRFNDLFDRALFDAPRNNNGRPVPARSGSGAGQSGYSADDF
ncbi:MAG: phage/plasmid primase, P4 family [Paracoccus sp. (in: a-proteobacteria)]|nr:phage/plasmid primase, P4 family [Paracoccus sp. (in: a-proteobacteria)]